MRNGNEPTAITESAVNYPLLYRVTSKTRRFCLGHTAMTPNGTSYEMCLEELSKEENA